jgi:hypothetical protein
MFAAMVTLFYLYDWFLRIGSLTLDIATGRTFPIPAHGALYITIPLGVACYAPFFTAVTCFVLCIVISYLLDRKNVRMPWHHWSDGG